METALNIANNLFRKLDGAPGSDAAKLQDIRDRQALRQRERKLAERHERNQKRHDDPLISWRSI